MHECSVFMDQLKIMEKINIYLISELIRSKNIFIVQYRETSPGRLSLKNIYMLYLKRNFLVTGFEKKQHIISMKQITGFVNPISIFYSFS